MTTSPLTETARRVTRYDVQLHAAPTRLVASHVVMLLRSKSTDYTPELSNDRQSLSLAIHIFPNETVYVYACSWSRGWSVFVTDRPDAGAHSWRDVPKKYQGLQRPLYVPNKDTTGPWRVSAFHIADAISNLADHLKKLDTARRARFRKTHWYWANSLERKAAE